MLSALTSKKLRLSNILATFNKTLADCEALTKQNDAAISVKTQEVAKINIEIGTLTTEKNSAARVATKLRELLA